MELTPEQWAGVLARLERLERKLDAALRPVPKLLSKRAAARMLGIDRGTTLELLIRGGELRLVLGKIPLLDVERLLTEGEPRRPPRPRKTGGQFARLRSVAEEADAIRRIDLRDLSGQERSRVRKSLPRSDEHSRPVHHPRPVYRVDVEPGPSDPEVARKIVDWLRERLR